MTTAQQSDLPDELELPTLPWGVRALAEELPESGVANSLKQLARQLEQGESWEAALNDPDVRLPEHIRGLLQASVRTNNFAGTLERFVHMNRCSTQLRRDMWLSIAYPLAVMVALGVLFSCFEIFVVGELARLYDTVMQDFSLNTSRLVLPAMTKLMMAWSGTPALLLLAAVLLVGVVLPLVWLLWRPLWLDVVAHRLPIIGPMLLWAGTADLCRLLGLLLESGLPLPSGLLSTAAGLRSSELAQASRRLSRRAELGQPLAEAVSVTPPLPDTLAPIVQWGEMRSSVPQALDAAAEMYEGRVRTQAAFVRLFLPPCVFLFAGGVILFSMVVIFLPMIRLIGVLM